MGAIMVGTLAATRLRVEDYCVRVQDNGYCIGDAIKRAVIDVQSNGLQLFRKNRFKTLQNPQFSLTNRRIYIIIC